MRPGSKRQAVVLWLHWKWRRKNSLVHLPSNSFARAFNFSFQHIFQLPILTILFVLGCFCSIPILESKAATRHNLQDKLPRPAHPCSLPFRPSVCKPENQRFTNARDPKKGKIDENWMFLNCSDSQLKASEMLRSLQNSSATPASESLNLSSADLGGKKTHKDYFEATFGIKVVLFFPSSPAKDFAAGQIKFELLQLPWKSLVTQVSIIYIGLSK